METNLPTPMTARGYYTCWFNVSKAKSDPPSQMENRGYPWLEKRPSTYGIHIKQDITSAALCKPNKHMITSKYHIIIIIIYMSLYICYINGL